VFVPTASQLLHPRIDRLFRERKAFDNFRVARIARENINAESRFAVVDVDQRKHAVTNADRVADGKFDLVCLHALPPAVFQTSH